MASRISPTQFGAQVQAAVDELIKINERMSELSNHSFEEFPIIYDSFCKMVTKVRGLEITAKLFRPNFDWSISTCYEILEAMRNKSYVVFDELTDIILMESQSLSNKMSLEECSQKIKKIFQRIEIFKTMQPQIESHSKVQWVLKNIQQIQGESSSSSPSSSSNSLSSSASTDLNHPPIPSMEQCIQELPAITQEFLQINDALESEINRMNFNYFAPIAIAFQDTVNRGNGFIRVNFSNEKFIQNKSICLDAFESTKNKVNERIDYFVKKINDQVRFLKEKNTQSSVDNILGSHARLSKDIQTLLTIRPKLKNDTSFAKAIEFVAETTEILNQFHVESSLRNKDSACGSSSSDSSSSSFSSSSDLSSCLSSSSSSFSPSLSSSFSSSSDLSSSLSLSNSSFSPSLTSLQSSFSSSSSVADTSLFGDISNSLAQDETIPAAKRRAYSGSSRGFRELPSHLSITIPSDDDRENIIFSMPVDVCSSLPIPGTQSLTARAEDQALRFVMEQSLQEALDRDILRAMELSTNQKSSNSESSQVKKEGE